MQLFHSERFSGFSLRRGVEFAITLAFATGGFVFRKWGFLYYKFFV